MKGTSWNVQYRSYLLERTPWKVPHGTYIMEVT